MVLLFQLLQESKAGSVQEVLISLYLELVLDMVQKRYFGASRSMPIGSLLHQGLDITAITVATGNSIIVVGDQIVAKKIEAR
jgi:hypothetical protein